MSTKLHDKTAALAADRPMATYKTIHDLKKRVSELEKALEAKETPVKKTSK